MSNNRRIVTWMVDSGSTESLHLSGPHSADEGRLGHIRRDEDGEWSFVEVDGTVHGPFNSISRAKKQAVVIVKGEYL